MQREYLGVDTINLPDTKNGRAFVLPIGRMAQMVIASVPETDGYVFPASRLSGTIPHAGWGTQFKGF